MNNLSILKIFEDGYLTFDDVLLSPSYSDVKSRLDPSIETNLGGVNLGIPIISSPMDTVTEDSMAISIGKSGGMGIIHRFISYEKQILMLRKVARSTPSDYKGNKPPVVPAIGVGSSEKNRLIKILEGMGSYKLDAIAIDIANGHSSLMKDMIDFVRKEVGEQTTIIAGNIATGDGYSFLADCGADAIRVGIGGGSICKTRIMTGFGIPTLSSVALANVAKHNGGYSSSIIADGGIRYPSDLVKSIVAGADAIMCGKIFAGTDEAPGGLIESGGKTYKSYRGMASLEAQESRGSGLKKGTCAEGVSTMIPYTGSADSVLNDLCGGLRSAMTYAGALNIGQLRNSNFIKISRSSLDESHAFGTKK